MKVFCNICKRNVPCTNGTHPQQFLRRHQGQCKKLLNQTRSVVLNTPPSKKTQVRSLLINEYGESFRPTFGHNDWICEAYNDEDLSDVDINSVMETLIVQTAEDCGFLDRADVLIETAHGSGSDIVYSLIQMIKYEEKLRGFDINRLCSSSAVKDIQLKLQELLMEDEMPDKKLIRFRNMHNKTVDWTDLIQLYDFGLSVGLSDAAGNRLLSVMNEIFAKPNMAPIFCCESLGAISEWQ